MPYRIITFDGGGTRGLYTAVILEKLCQAVPQLLANADLLAGTSTGGLITLALADGRQPAELVALYRDKARQIFEDSWIDDALDLGPILGADYGNAQLEKLLGQLIRARTLGELKKKVVVPTFCLDNGKPPPNRRWTPKFFHNFEGDDSDAAAGVVDVALRTSAAPSYFPTYQGFVDGGVMANNPSMAALATALDPRAGQQKLDDIVLLSLGTGLGSSFIESRAARGTLDWGYKQWAKHIIPLMIDGSVNVADFQCRQILGPDRYRRVNSHIPIDLPLDDVKHLDQLIEWADEVPLDEVIPWLREVFVASPVLVPSAA